MQEEISLREIIETIWNGKWMIILITVVFMALSGIYSFLITKPVYEADSLVRFDVNSADKTDVTGILNSFTETIQSNVTVNKVIGLLGLDEKGYTVNGLRSAVSVVPVKDSNVVQITVKGQDPGVITDVANLLAYRLGAKEEITDRSAKIVDSQNQLLDIDDKIAVAQKELDSAKKLLASTPEKLVTQKSLATDPYLQSVAADQGNIPNKDLGAIQLQDEQINPVYLSLTQKISDSQLQLTNLSAQKDNLNHTIQTNQDMINALDKQMDNTKLQATNSDRLLSGFNAVFISPSLTPSVPVGPHKLINVVLAAVIGAMLSLVIVFIRQYWKNTSVNAVQGRNISA